METRLLNLSSYDINASDTLADYYNKTVSTPFGTVSDNRWSLTWNNIDLSKVLGDDFYNRFNLFKITLINYNLLLSPTSKISTQVTAQHYQDAYINWYLQGLPFYPPVYNNIASGAVLNTGYIPLDPSSASFTMTNSLSWSFTKVKTTNISINMRSVATGLPYNPGSDTTYLWGHSTLTFQITGIPDIIFPTPLPITYGTTLVSSLNASIISGIAGDILYYLNNSKTAQAFSTVVLNAGISTIYADFVPTNSFYSGYTQATSLQVNKAPTSTLFTTPPTITYGQTPTLTSSGSMPGTFSYFTDANFNNQVTESTIFNAGTHTIYSRLTPTSTNYASSSDSKQLVVNKAATFITFPNITSILYGVTTGSTALASLLNGTVANILGGTYNFYLNNASGQVVTTSTLLSAGSYTIYCEYTSQNNNYLSSTGSTTIAIQAHPTSATFSVSTPASIVYGTDLTSILNATADIVQGSTVAGTVSYYKNAEYTQTVVTTDILPYGNYTIYAVFQPTNTTNYLSSVVTTFLTVTQRPTVITVSSQTIVYQTEITTALIASVLTDIGGAVDGAISFYYNNTYTDLFTNYNNLNVGTYTVYVRFLPLRSNFAISTASYSLTVTQKPTTITFPTIVDVSYNATLNSFITNTTAEVSGTFTFTDVTANVLTTSSVYNNLGQYLINASFTPTNSNYATSAATYSNLYVRFADTLSFTTATATITYGDSLNGLLVTNTPTFNGTPISGVTTYMLSGTVVNNSTNLIPRVPDTLAYTITATFVPADSTSYYTIIASNTKSVVVQKRLCYPNIGAFSGYLLDTPPVKTINYDLIFQDTSSNSITFSKANIYYIENTSSFVYSYVTSLPKVTDTYMFTTPFSGTLKYYNNYVILDNFYSDKYVQAWNKYTVTINKRPTLLSFNIPDSIKTISYGTPLSSNHLSATLTDTLTNTQLTNKTITYTFSATDMAQTVIQNSVLNSGTYYLFANFVDVSNIYLSGNTFSQRTNTITVSKVKSTLTTPNITSIAYGTTMNGFITGTTKNVNGSLRFFTPQ